MHRTGAGPGGGSVPGVAHWKGGSTTTPSRRRTRDPHAQQKSHDNLPVTNSSTLERLTLMMMRMSRPSARTTTGNVDDACELLRTSAPPQGCGHCTSTFSMIAPNQAYLGERRCPCAYLLGFFFFLALGRFAASHHCRGGTNNTLGLNINYFPISISFHIIVVPHQLASDATHTV